jgi:hypothetical protein
VNEKGQNEASRLSVIHHCNGELHENGFASPGIPFDPEKPSWLIHPSLVLRILEEPLTSVLCGMNAVVPVLLFSK